jgi:hypothetical protein
MKNLYTSLQDSKLSYAVRMQLIVCRTLHFAANSSALRLAA